MQRLLALVTAAAWAVSLSAPVGAAEDPVCEYVVDVNGSRHRVCEGTVIDHLPGESPASSPSGDASRTSGPRVPMKAVGTLGEDEFGNPCVATTYIPMEQEAPPESDLIQFIMNDCPLEPAAPGEGAPAIDPQAIARRVWLSRPSPQPTPEIPPGRMLVGLPAYLVTNAQLHDEIDTDTAIGPLHMTATAELWVDWGDGSGLTGPYRSPGAPYPDGDITHVYQHHGTYDVIVIQRWSVEWSFAGASGTFVQDDAPVTIDDYPVIEVQAVLE
jgi:hypothetical protein